MRHGVNPCLNNIMCACTHCRNFSENVHLTVRVRAKQPGGIVFLNTSGVELPLPPLAAPNGLQNGKVRLNLGSVTQALEH